MTMNRVQFQPGLSMTEFMDRYGCDEQCEAALIAARWPAGFACPACGCGQRSSFRREARLYFQCTACRHQCSVISGTIFEATKLWLSRWFLAMHLLTQSKNNVAALELMRHLGVCYKTARLIKHKLMEVMRVREDTRQLAGTRPASCASSAVIGVCGHALVQVSRGQPHHDGEHAVEVQAQGDCTLSSAARCSYVTGTNQGLHNAELAVRSRLFHRDQYSPSRLTGASHCTRSLLTVGPDIDTT